MNFGIRNDPTCHFCGFEAVGSLLGFRTQKEKRWVKGIDCIFVGYAEHSKAYRPNDIILNSDESQRDDHSNDVPSETPEPRRGCEPLSYKWIFKRMMKVDGTIDKFKARLLIQGFRQKEGIDYFDNYAPVARITTIRLLLALETIHNLVIHQMDVKTTFLIGDLKEEVYMKQLEGFVMPCNKHKVSKLVKSLYGLEQAPKKLHQKFNEVVLSSGFLLNQSDKCVYSKFDDSEAYSDASWINHVEDSSSTSGCVFLLGRGAILWASKNQTCITGSTMKSEFIALAAAGK
nr:zinc finger, CCHC-type [Tanacetum cinerariifolium]